MSFMSMNFKRFATFTFKPSLFIVIHILKVIKHIQGGQRISGSYFFYVEH